MSLASEFFMGLDTGYARLGYSIIGLSKKESIPHVIDYGVIETGMHESDQKRLMHLEKSLDSILSKKQIHACALEEVFIRKNISTGTRLLQARGVILLVLGKNNIPVHAVSPTAVKKMLTGSGTASKHQMQNMVTKLLKLKEIPKPDDAADAVALSLCAWLRYMSKSPLMFNIKSS